ncbi:hypothetical protein H6228_002676 [Enterococcus faecalis]|nr:hypothetical protein [Enterococcus faecalis]EGO5075587.1 hypothetical protein [Enterococcus faecalis]HBI1613464.1 hypothetical protein [Enterococcus faecalis]
MNFFQNLFDSVVGEAKYFVMICMLIAAGYFALERKVSKVIPIILAVAVAVWFVGDTAGVFDWLLNNMKNWGR